MIAAPWWLLAAGILVLIVGLLLAGLGGNRPTHIDPRMSDDDIAEELGRSQDGGPARFIVGFGLLLIFISVVWRLVRFFL